MHQATVRSMTNHSLPYRFTKRTLDIVGASIGLLVLSPLLIAVAVWIKLDSPGPVFYRGRRIGREGEEFRIFKFRSMVQDADKIGGPTTSGDDPRLTRSGRFVRRFNIDEMPQLLNVLLGQMSLVGPRPDVPSEAEKLSQQEREIILSVRPGMTDFASIQFNNENEIVQGHDDPHAAYEELIRPKKIELQKRYVREASLFTDLKILWRTVFVTLGVSRSEPAEA